MQSCFANCLEQLKKSAEERPFTQVLLLSRDRATATGQPHVGPASVSKSIFEEIYYLPHSFVLAPADYYMFPYLRK